MQDQDYSLNDDNFLASLRAKLQQTESEVSERNQYIEERDEYVYSDLLDRSIDIPIGHDFTPVNWLKRTVEIHKTMFMGRPFQAISSYDTQDLSMVADTDRDRVEIENKKEKTFAELRRNLIDGIIRDNGGHAIFADGAESASAIGSWIVKTWYDADTSKFMISPVEAVENCYVCWSGNDFRQFDLIGYAYQLSKAQAASQFGLDEDELVTSPSGAPFLVSNPPGIQIGDNNSSLNRGTSQNLGEPMVTILEATGIVEGWGTKNGNIVPVSVGKENPLNCVYVGNKRVRLETNEKNLPRYYIFPNKRIRRRPWGISDITDAAININVTYIETLSDWRTIASKVNFPKFKGFNFGESVTMPKITERKIQLLPLADGQDINPLNMGTDNSVNWGNQLDELKEQFVRETGISRVLFDDPSVTFNSNQALLTAMKPTSDIAENKKQLWTPILTQMFTDAINTIAAHKTEFADLATGNWSLKIQWPSVMQKEDPVFQQMLLNRWNTGTLSLQTYLEMQGETKEEIDRMREEFYDPVTAAAIGHSLGALSQYVLGLPQNQAEFTEPQATVANNTPGTQPVSQPGSGAPPVSPQGAINQTAQNAGL